MCINVGKSSLILILIVIDDHSNPVITVNTTVTTLLDQTYENLLQQAANPAREKSAGETTTTPLIWHLPREYYVISFRKI